MNLTILCPGTVWCPRGARTGPEHLPCLPGKTKDGPRRRTASCSRAGPLVKSPFGLKQNTFFMGTSPVFKTLTHLTSQHGWVKMGADAQTCLPLGSCKTCPHRSSHKVQCMGLRARGSLWRLRAQLCTRPLPGVNPFLDLGHGAPGIWWMEPDGLS